MVFCTLVCNAQICVRGTGNEGECRYFTFSHMKDEGDKHPGPWKHLFWSFRALESGFWPQVDPDGKAIVDGRAGEAIAMDEGGKPFTAVLLFAKGSAELSRHGGRIAVETSHNRTEVDRRRLCPGPWHGPISVWTLSSCLCCFSSAEQGT